MHLEERENKRKRLVVRVVRPDGPMGRVTATPREQPTQPLVAFYDLQARSGSIYRPGNPYGDICNIDIGTSIIAL